MFLRNQTTSQKIVLFIVTALTTSNVRTNNCIIAYQRIARLARWQHTSHPLISQSRLILNSVTATLDKLPYPERSAVQLSEEETAFRCPKLVRSSRPQGSSITSRKLYSVRMSYVKSFRTVLSVSPPVPLRPWSLMWLSAYCKWFMLQMRSVPIAISLLGNHLFRS
jgi:hypothetical protein